MIYSLGDISGAPFNPVVTLAVVASGRKKCSLIDGIIHGFFHILAGVFAVCAPGRNLHYDCLRMARGAW